MAETHLRITEAAIELHGTVGPSRTTMSAVAKRAGVERRTLYRHFPNEADLFAACSTHYFIANPWPDLDTWRAIRDPQQRLERAIDELYAYYERTEPMFSNVLRDAELVDFARDAVAPLRVYLEEAAEILTMARPARGRRRQLLGGALRHALAFSTWQSLTTSGIGRSDAGKLMSGLVEAAATPGEPSRTPSGALQNIARYADERAELWIARRPAPHQGAAELRHPRDRNEAQVSHVGHGGSDGGIDDLASGDSDRDVRYGALAHRDSHTRNWTAPRRSGRRYRLVELSRPVVKAQKPVIGELLHVHGVAIRQRVIVGHGQCSGLLGEHGSHDQVGLVQREPCRHQVDVVVA